MCSKNIKKLLTESAALRNYELSQINSSNVINKIKEGFIPTLLSDCHFYLANPKEYERIVSLILETEEEEIKKMATAFISQGRALLGKAPAKASQKAVATH